MEQHRGTQRLADLTRGPGRLAKALDVNKRFDGVDLCDEGALWLGAAMKRTGKIGISIRIGITREVHQLYRFYERGNPFVSGLKRLRE
jgi:DNA-3-methyladenine glycosylase